MQFVFIWDFPRKAAEKMPAKRLKSIRSLWHLMLPIWKRHIIWMTKWNLKLKRIKGKMGGKVICCPYFTKKEIGNMYGLVMKIASMSSRDKNLDEQIRRNKK